MKKITLLHTVKSMYNTFPQMIEKALNEKVEMTNIVDEVLVSNTEKKGYFTDWNKERLLSDLKVAEEENSDLIVVTCSSLTPYAISLMPLLNKPLITIDKAMCRKAAEKGNNILVLATAKTTIEPTVNRIKDELKSLNKNANVTYSLRLDAMDALKRGDKEEHDKILREEAGKFSNIDLVVLAQASMMSAKEGVQKEGDWIVLTSPELCIEEIKKFYDKH